MMGCKAYRYLVSLAVGNDLSAAEDRRLQAHLESCSDCRTYYAEMLESRNALTALAGEEIGKESLARVRNQVLQELSRARHRSSGTLSTTIQSIVASLQSRRPVLSLPRLAAAAVAVVLLAAGALLLPELIQRRSSRARPLVQQLSPATEAGRPSVPTEEVADDSAPVEPAPSPATLAMPEPAAEPMEPVERLRSTYSHPAAAPVTERAAVPRSVPPATAAPVAVAAVPPEPMVIRFFSEQDDVVVYWFIDPATTKKES
jgi:hypothetical protein